MTQYGHQHYYPEQRPIEPLPILKPIHNQETVGEFPALRTPSQPLKEPPAHFRKPGEPPDQLASHSQRLIKKYAHEIYEILQPPCPCDECRNAVMVQLSDLISECMTDQTILTLTLGKLQRSFDRLNENVERFLGGHK